MGKKKDAKKLTPIGRERRLRLEAEKSCNELHAKLTYEQARSADNDRRLNILLIDKNATINRQEMEISRAREDTAAARAERDRLIRMVDQFTSVQIIGHGQILSPHTMATPQQPGALRRTA